MGSENLREIKPLREISWFTKLVFSFFDMIEKPIEWFKENVVDPNREEYYWYHENIKRVPTIDECYKDDIMCQHEAEAQYRLDRKVDSNILEILKRRAHQCVYEYGTQASECQPLQEAVDKAADNYFIKYGDLGFRHNAYFCYMKQKHRMAWERRHGPVGSGRKEEALFPEKKTC